MNVVIPMAGRGHRFVERGTTTPKPLIDVRGKPMYCWAVDSLPLEAASRLVFVVLRQHQDALGASIRERYARFDPVVVALDEVTEGQACTVLQAESRWDAEAPLLVYNADTHIGDLGSEFEAPPAAAAAGVVSVFQAPGDRWSFARLGERGQVVETAEKRRISEWAMTGLYRFGSAELFARHARDMIAAGEHVRGEYYVAPVYNRIIAEGGFVLAAEARDVWVLGTPEDLAHFEDAYPKATP